MIVVDITLVPGTNQTEFVESFADNDSVELVDLLEFLPNLLLLKIEESYIDTFAADSRVLSVDIDEPAEPSSIGYSLPASTTQDGDATAEAPLTVLDDDNAPGADYMPLALYADTDVMPEPESQVGNTDTNPDGDDADILEDVEYTSMFFGENVDIVSLEASGNFIGTEITDWDRYHTDPHPDFADPDNPSISRWVPTTWPNTTNQSFDPNDQTASIGGGTFGESNWFGAHAIGTLSVAGGAVAGFAKKANLHHIFEWSNTQAGTGSNSIQCINNVVSWHNSKANNPDTGVPNPTVFVLPIQWSINKEWICPVDRIDSVTHDGVTSNRPVGGWGNDLTPFTDKNITPFRLDLQAAAGVASGAADRYTWAVTWSREENTTLKNAIEAAWDAGIVVLCAVGNMGCTYVKRDDAAHDNSTMHIENSEEFYKMYYASDADLQYYGTFIAGGVGNSNNGAGETVYPFRSFGPHGCSRDKSIDVGAVQNSMKNPIIEYASSRGAGVDIMGRGNDTYSSYPNGRNFADGDWGYFTGTSAAVASIAGMAACEMSKYYYNTGRWPTPNQVKEILTNQSKDNPIKELEGGSIFHAGAGSNIDITGKSFSDMPPATAGFGWFTNSHHYYRTEMDFYNDPKRNLLQSHRYQYSGRHNSLDLMGTTAKIGFFNAKGFDRAQSQGRRPREGGVYPRPKIRRD